MRHGEIAGHVRGHHFARDLRGHRRGFAQQRGGEVHVEMSPAGGGARLIAHGCGEIRGARLEQVRGLVELGAPGTGTLRRPGRECVLRGGHGGYGVVDGGGRGTGDHVTGDRVATFESGAATRRLFLAADQQIHVVHRQFPRVSLQKG